MKLKRFRLRLAIVLAMIFTMIGSTVVFADTLDYSTSLKNMQDLGIIESFPNDINSYVTRGQLVKSIVIAEGKSKTAANLNGSTIFPDIDSTSELSGYINEGLNLGINEGINQSVITGRADGNFHANDQLTYGEACTIMVRLLGYTDKDLTGAWPNNYIQKAADLDITTDITLKRSDKVTLGVEAIMFNRLFDSTMKKSSTSGSDSFFSDNYYNDTTVTGNLKEVVVLGNSKTADDLSENEILTDNGIYTLKIGVSTPEVGGKYKMYVDGTIVTKIAVKENSLEDYAVSNASGSSITYTGDDNSSKTMILPKAFAYYYHGASVDRDIAVKSIQAYSSVIISKDSNGNTDYAVIVDPSFSSPLVYDYQSKDVAELLCDTSIKYIYRDGKKYDSDDSVDFDDQDVVYKVSDLWGKNSCVYIYNAVVCGKIKSITPNRFNPTSAVISARSVSGTTTDAAGNTKKTYSTSSSTYYFSKYFNKSDDYLELLNVYNDSDDYNYDDTLNFILGIDGKILGIYE